MLELQILIPTFISLTAVVISLVALVRTRRYSEHDYMARLEIVNEESESGAHPGFAYRYEAGIKNNGIKPVDILQIHIEYGSLEDNRGRMFQQVMGKLFLAPGETKRIKFQLTWVLVDVVISTFALNECFIFLRVLHKTPSGNIVEIKRLLTGVGRKKGSIILHKTESLS